MRISDWSSDVCSSDLQGARAAARGEAHRLLVRRFRARDAGVIDLATGDGRDLARQHAAGAGDAGRRSQRDRNEEDPGTAFDRPQLFLVAAVVFHLQAIGSDSRLLEASHGEILPTENFPTENLEERLKFPAQPAGGAGLTRGGWRASLPVDRKRTRLNSSH